MTYREELDALRLALRRSREREAEAFDRGFDAATRMAEAGASPRRLREASGVPHAVPRADAVVVDEWAEDTDVDGIPGAP